MDREHRFNRFQFDSNAIEYEQINAVFIFHLQPFIVDWKR